MIKIEFWGVRGSLPCCGAEYDFYGGDTSCVAVQVEDQLLIFDGGTGIRHLGETIDVSSAHLFLTHAHYDHIMGLPFFKPLWDKNFQLDIYAGPLEDCMSTKDFFNTLMSAPFFPVESGDLSAKIVHHDLKENDIVKIGDNISVKTIPIRHPNGATGYRVDTSDYSVCYITDIEHEGAEPQPDLINFILNTSCLIYDTTYSPEEYPNKRGWGHSTWVEGIKLARAANVGKFVGFHHSMDYTDQQVSQLESKMQQELPAAVMARQGMVIELN